MTDQSAAEAIAEAELKDLLHYLVDKVTHSAEDTVAAWHARIDEIFAPPAPAPAPTEPPAATTLPAPTEPPAS